MPTPKWKLVVDIGSAPPKIDEKVQDNRIPDMLKLLAENMPTSSNSPLAPYLPGFTALRLLLLKRNRTPEDNDYTNTMLDSYSSYLSNGKTRSETAWMVARDFMLLDPTVTAQQSTVIPQSFQSISTGQPPPHAPQVQHQAKRQQLGQVQSTLQHTQHNPSQLAQHMQQQLQHHQFQQTHRGALQQQHQQQSAATVSSISLGAPAPHMGVGTSIARAPTPQDGAGHFALQNGQNNLSQNGIAALSHITQHIAHTNGMSTLQNDKSGVPGV